jgi:hypothetical protein
MSAKDIFHEAVRQALQKEGWIITHDPLYIEVGGVEMLIDLGAERLIAAEKEGQKIAVEIKSFTRSSTITVFHSALGQFLNYQLALEKREPDRALYLAVPLDIYNTFFKLELVETAVERYQLALVIYNPKLEVIVKWTR